MFCHNCGFNNNDGAAFCANCGTPMKKNFADTVPQPVSEPKKNKSPLIIVAVLLAVIIAASALIFMMPKSDKSYTVYIKDNQLFLAFEGEKDHILLDEELIKGYNMLSSSEKQMKAATVERSLETGFKNKVFYSKQISADPVKYELMCYDIKGGKAEKVILPYQLCTESDYSVAPVADNSKVYFRYNENIYAYDFDTIEKIATNTYHMYYCPDTDRIVYSVKSGDDGEYNMDIYTVDSDDESVLVVDEVSIKHTNEEKDIYVFADYTDRFYTYINGVKSEAVVPDVITDDAEIINVLSCTEDGTLFFNAREDTEDGYEWKRYLCKDGEYELAPDNSRLSEDGNALFCFERTSDDDSDEYYGTLTGYEVNGVDITETARYNDVAAWDVLADNKLLIWKNREKNNYNYTYDLYYNDIKIGTDAYRYQIGGGKGDHIYTTYVSEDFIVYLSDPSTDDGKQRFTLNVYDGKKSEEIAYNVPLCPVVSSDGKVVFICNWDNDENVGDLKVYDAGKTEEIAFGVSGFNVPEIIEKVALY